MSARLGELGLIRWRLALGATLLMWVLAVIFIPQAQAGFGKRPFEGVFQVAGSDDFGTPCAENRRISSTGASLWARTYGGSGIALFGEAQTIQQTADGGYIVAGHTRFYGTGSQDIWVLKLDAEGEIEWQRTYGGRGWEEVRSIQQTADGGYILVGSTTSFGAGETDAWVLKLAPNGDVEWQKTYGNIGSDTAASVQQTSDGGYIVAGSYYSDAWLLKLDRNGNVRWQRIYRGVEMAISVNDFQQTADGGYILAGLAQTPTTFNFWVLKLDANGRVQWSKTYGRSEWDEAYAVQQSADGGYIVAGQTRSASTGDDAWVLKLAPNGDIEWQKTYGGGEDDYAYDIKQTRDGGYILVGYTWSFGAGNVDAWILKLDPEGRVQWQRTYGTRAGEEGRTVRKTADGGYVVAGWQDDGLLVLKMNAQGDIPGCNLIASSTPEVRNTDIRGTRPPIEVRWPSIRVQNTNATITTSTAFTRIQCIVYTTPTPTPTPTSTPTPTATPTQPPTPTPTPTTGTVEGYVWADADRDGERDVGEEGLAGLTVQLASASVRGRLAQVREAVTDAEGFFRFTDVMPGRYTLSLVYPGGVYPVSDLTQEVDVAANTVVNVGFALYPLPQRHYLPAVMR